VSGQRLVLSAPEPATLEVQGIGEFSVRIGADLDVDVMAELLAITQEYRKYGNKPDRLGDWIMRAKRLIFQIVEQEDPDPDQLVAFKRRAMSPSEALQILSLCSGNTRGVEAEVIDALGEGVEEGEGQPLTDPTNSPRRSRGRSSRSARRSTSRRDTGEGSDGVSSGSISATSTAA
jgi:hypothetical protein